ncbi:hypothetical protein UFOVP184_36 [uncultured Caudovirales phage]|uniref:Uncharacterized protein n=1 Tax=uncultured Caudovirales phage TaxID=2100421 RepID=A0A6J7WDK6_9CAUD|nr:hypothetical protein UFOVP184_36 [uncultured Caudovirales phage]
MKQCEIDQSSGRIDFLFEPNDTVVFGLAFTATRANGTETPVSLANYTLSAAMTIVTPFDTTGTVTVLDAANGTVKVRFPDLATANLTQGQSYNYRVRWVTPDGVKFTPVTGNIEIVRGDISCGC